MLVPVFGLTGATAITAGRAHTCATLANGNVACWGCNLAGEIGYGATVPTLVTDL